MSSGIRSSDMDRGTGRTTRQLVSAPQKFFFVAHNWAMVNHARTLIRKHVPEKDVTIVLLDRIESLRGVSEPVVIDHWAIDLIHPRDLDWIRVMTSRNNPS